MTFGTMAAVPAPGRRPVRDGVGLVLGNDLGRPWTHRQLGGRRGVEVAEHDALGDGQRRGVAVPVAKVDLDVPLRGLVGAAALDDGERAEVVEYQAGLLQEFTFDGLVEGLVTFASSARQRPGSRIADGFVRIAQMEQVLTIPVNE